MWRAGEYRIIPFVLLSGSTWLWNSIFSTIMCGCTGLWQCSFLLCQIEKNFSSCLVRNYLPYFLLRKSLNVNSTSVRICFVLVIILKSAVKNTWKRCLSVYVRVHKNKILCLFRLNLFCTLNMPKNGEKIQVRDKISGWQRRKKKLLDVSSQGPFSRD